jgi:nickel-dependent lactate racemase
MKIQGVKVKGQADVVIASPGGFPKDINLYQGSKTYDTAEMALKPGGIVISLLEAREINDPPEYMQSFHFNDVIEMEKAVRNKFTIPFFIAYRLFLLCQNSTVYIVTRKENFDTVKKTGQIPVETLEEAWSLAQKQLAERGLKDYTVNIMQHAANTVPMID